MKKEIDKGAFGCSLGVFIFFIIITTVSYWGFISNTILRIGFVVGVPLLVSMATSWAIDRFEVTNKTMIILSKTLSISVGVYLIVCALLASQQSYHWENILVDKGGLTFEEEALKKGADNGNVIICVLLGLFFLMYGLRDIKIKTWFKSNNEQ